MEATTERKVQDLLQSAQEAARAGRDDDVARLCDQILKLSPDHPQALSHLGMRALQKGDGHTALSVLRRAAASAPKEPMVQFNLAVACRIVGDRQGEWDALERALVLDPYFFLALFAKAAWLERNGERRAAGRYYKEALKIAPPVEQQPAELKAAIAHAQSVVQANIEDLASFLRKRVAPERERFQGERLSRFDESLDVLAGKKKIYVSEPVLLNYARLPSIQYFEREDFPWLAQLEAATPAIREELMALLAEDRADFKPYVAKPPGAPVNQWGELNHSLKWSTYFLWRDGERKEAACKRCPKTAEVLANLPMADTPGYAPTAFFSALAPRSHIPAHTGVTNTRLITHLGLIVPGQCRFRVGNDTREWEEGKAWVFDDSIEHEAWNDSGDLRVVLIFDVWNPALSQAEREMISAMMAAYREYYQAPSG
jgi:aspartyl/asparaginyl beta-hydroxylase (cupin superfamily)